MRSLRSARLLLSVGVLALSSCSLFDTREPEDPVVVRSTFDPPTDALTVLSNLSASLRELNEVNYLRCLSDSLTGGALRFIATPEASSRYGAFAEWDKGSERDYFLNMRSKLPAGVNPTLILGTPTTESATPDSVNISVSYDLTIPTGQAAMPDRGRGRAVFTMVLDRMTGFWAIRTWQDFSVDLTTSSWSDIKGAFFQ